MAIKNDFVVKHGLTVTNTATINQDLIVVGSIKKNGVDVGYGYTGSQGSIGYTGSQGIQGVTGYTGSQGIQGNIGYTGSQGNIGYTGSQGAQGIAGYTGSQGVIGYTGSKGDSGLGFTIAKTYASVAALTADATPTGIVAGQFALIETGDVENPENSRLYLWNGSAYTYVSDLSGAQGITGPQGVIGYTGSQGTQGVIGYTGSQGAQGVIGYTGSQGNIGYTGSQGNIGYTGSQGTQGVIGYTGSQGTQGVIGYTGSQGAIGYTGSQGTQGVIGYTGSQGTQGVIGYTGSQGTQGVIGYTGSQGAIGYTGSQGTQGVIGYTGSQGAQGVIGYTGSQGTQGVIGYTGSAGPSNVLNATAASTSSVQYFVGVPATGSNQTPNASTTVPVVFQPSTGKVGIGTNAPVAKLDVNGASASNIVAVAASDIDCSLGNYFTKTINGATTFTFSNVPASRAFSFVLAVTHTSGAITWPASVSWPNSTAPTLTTGKTHLFVFVTSDGGSTWRGNSSVNY